MPVDHATQASSRLRPGPFVAAVAAGAAIVASSPFMADLRNALKDAFPARFPSALGGLVAAAGAAAVLVALIRIRDRHAPRYLAVGAAVATAAVYARTVATGNADVDAVERVHFVQYGIVTLLFYRAWRPLDDGSLLLLPALCALVVGTADEAFQWFVPVRVGELHDVLIDAVAIVCGVSFAAGLDPPRHGLLRMREGSLSRLGAATGATLLVVAGFIDAVHLGYLVRDDRIGAFRSRHTKEALAAAAQQRAAQWRLRPPLTLRRLSREDQYVAEALWHVERRNDAWAAGDVVSAWRENEILDAYYGPVLDTPSYVSPTGHRWAARQRAEAAARAPIEAPPSVSRAERSAIFLWPKAPFRIAALLASCAILILCRRLDRRRRARGATPAAP